MNIIVYPRRLLLSLLFHICADAAMAKSFDRYRILNELWLQIEALLPKRPFYKPKRGQALTSKIEDYCQRNFL
jgi:hypothetical protein